MMSNASRRKHAHMNGSLKLCKMTSVSYQIRYIINCWNNRRTALTRYLQVKLRSVVRLVSRQDFTELPAAANMVEDDDAFCRSFHRFTVVKMILEISIRRKHELNNDMMKRAERGRNFRDTANLNQMIFYVRSMST